MAEENTTKESNARALGRDLPISTKQSIEICNFVRGNKLNKAKEKLNDAISMKKAIPFKRFTKDTGHKRNMAAGRYVVKACSNILKIIESAEANAKNKGLNISNLIVKSIIANKGNRAFRYGRTRRIKNKRTHIEVVVEEAKK